MYLGYSCAALFVSGDRGNRARCKGFIATIVVLRTALNFFLQRELAEAQRREAAATMGSPGAANTGSEWSTPAPSD